MLSVDVVKINQRNYYQNRFICITTQHIFSMKSSSTLSRIFSKKKLEVRRKIGLKEINRIVYSSSSDQFILGNQVYDLVYESQHRNDIIEYTLRSLHLSCPGQYSLPFYFVKDYGLNDVANHEHRPPVKLLKEEPIVGCRLTESINFEEFWHGFLQKPLESLGGAAALGGDRNSNEIPLSAQKIPMSPQHSSTMALVAASQERPRVKVSVSDFQFIKVLGRGGFSTVYLVKHRETHEMFAMKSIRIPAGKLDKDKSTFLQQIRYEKQILMALKHPFIVKLKYAFCAKRRFFLVMALVQGGEFLGYIRTCQKKKIEEV